MNPVYLSMKMSNLEQFHVPIDSKGRVVLNKDRRMVVCKIGSNKASTVPLTGGYELVAAKRSLGGRILHFLSKSSLFRRLDRVAKHLENEEAENSAANLTFYNHIGVTYTHEIAKSFWQVSSSYLSLDEVTKELNVRRVEKINDGLKDLSVGAEGAKASKSTRLKLSAAQQGITSSGPAASWIDSLASALQELAQPAQPGQTRNLARG